LGYFTFAPSLSIKHATIIILKNAKNQSIFPQNIRFTAIHGKPMGNYFFLQVFTVIFALSIATTIFNKRVLGFPQAIGVPIVSAIFVFILQWAASLFNGNPFIVINLHNIEEAVRNIDFYDFLINGVICFILTSLTSITDIF